MNCFSCISKCLAPPKPIDTENSTEIKHAILHQYYRTLEKVALSCIGLTVTTAAILGITALSSSHFYEFIATSEGSAIVSLAGIAILSTGAAITILVKVKIGIEKAKYGNAYDLSSTLKKAAILSVALSAVAIVTLTLTGVFEPHCHAFWTSSYNNIVLLSSLSFVSLTSLIIVIGLSRKSIVEIIRRNS